MQTAAISYRVADFLRRHAPFEYMEESDLLALASRGRVKFHEADEFVCWQGEAHGPHLFVIQQGSVSLWEGIDGEEKLRDIRGPGDLVGLERFLGQETSPASARTNSDVVLYALHAGDFEPLIGKYREVRRYLASHSSIHAGEEEDHRRSAAGVGLKELAGTSIAVTCAASASVRVAARLLAESDARTLAVVGDGGKVAGVLTTERLTRWVAEGDGTADMPVCELMEEAALVCEDARLSECVLEMASGNGAAVITSDGSDEGEIRGVAEGGDLAPLLGEDPIGILRRIRAANDSATVRRQHQRARSFLLAQLDSTISVDWLTRYGRLLDETILRRALHLAGVEADGSCWCFAGAPGRGEALTPVMPHLVLVSTGDSATTADQGRLQRVRDVLAESGYVQQFAAGTELADCASVREWEERFRRWIEDPLNSMISTARPYFDLVAIDGDPQVLRRLEREVTTRLRNEPAFIFLLANDCLAQLPPLTFYRNLVVDESGDRSDIFRLEKSALTPLVDAARVFGLAAGSALGRTSTARFDMARRLFPEQAALFREATETLRFVLMHQGRAGIRHRSEGLELAPSQISSQDRLVFKSGFRCILRLLEFTSELKWEEVA